ncbi:unnamed protein product [Caenorhabditis sp. 36 PRJEB53466]|nr:unnamed protein product [Caenorhabditis sp. 36 PRJEB53466]
MPPKKRPTARKADAPTIKAFRNIPEFNKILNEAATTLDKAAGEVFSEVFKDIVDIFRSAIPDENTANALQSITCAKVEQHIAQMVTRQLVASPIESAMRTRPSIRSTRSSAASTRSKTKQRSIKKEIDEHPETIVEEDQDQDLEPESEQTNRMFANAPEDDGDDDMDVEDQDVTPRPETPPISSEMTDDEFEGIAVPSTLTRMQQMSISRKLEPVSSSSRTPVKHGTPRRNPARQAHTVPTTPRNVFQTTPGRTQAPAAAPRTPHRLPYPYQAPENEMDKKMKHADELRNKVIEQKKEQARKADEKRVAVMERRKEQEKAKQERIDEIKRKEEKTANFVRMQKEHRSPTRARLQVGEPKTPSSKSQSSRKIFAAVTTENFPTPGRVHAKRGRIEVATKNGKKTTVAEPTVRLSPSRNLPRNTSRQVKAEPMDLEKDITPIKQKPKAKAKRSHVSSAAAAADAHAAHLQAEQEQYLMKLAAEKKAAKDRELAEEQARVAADEKQSQAKKEAEEKAEAARRYQVEEMDRLKKLQEEEEQRLREQQEREEAELKATLAKQAEKKAKQQATGRSPPPDAYEMTPPRTYQAKSKNDYGLHDLNSDDETDQEDDPRKEVPEWADFVLVRDNVRKHTSKPPFDVIKFFGEIQKPNLKDIFGDVVRLKKRGSSAVWKSPAASSNHSRQPLFDISE